MTFTKLEQEVVILKTIWDLIDDMVNFALIEPLARTDEVTITFKTATHARLFNILLVDFLSLPSRDFFDLPSPAKGSSGTDRTFLFHLARVCNAAEINPEGIALLKAPLSEFVQWLEADCVVPRVWLSTIQIEADIRVKRITFIKICGNIAKHSTARLNADADAIRSILEYNGRPITKEQAYLALPDFYEWFHSDILIYHSSTIAEFLNNLRWGIFSYLQPEFRRAFTRDEGSTFAYHYVVPQDCRSEVGTTLYWDLMNAVRSEPYVPRFAVTPWLKLRY